MKSWWGFVFDCFGRVVRFAAPVVLLQSLVCNVIDIEVMSDTRCVGAQQSVQSTGSRRTRVRWCCSGHHSGAGTSVPSSTVHNLDPSAVK
ncbi:hypothetical protein DDJ45_10545 [Mycobacteroides abscessus]|nr:hypothetical protein DDJ45_10545 [Mycobacteroides abscessus]